LLRALSPHFENIMRVSLEQSKNSLRPRVHKFLLDMRGRWVTSFVSIASVACFVTLLLGTAWTLYIGRWDYATVQFLSAYLTQVLTDVIMRKPLRRGNQGHVVVPRGVRWSDLGNRTYLGTGGVDASKLIEAQVRTPRPYVNIHKSGDVGQHPHLNTSRGLLEAVAHTVAVGSICDAGGNPKRAHRVGYSVGTHFCLPITCPQDEVRGYMDYAIRHGISCCDHLVQDCTCRTHDTILLVHVYLSEADFQSMCSAHPNAEILLVNHFCSGRAGNITWGGKEEARWAVEGDNLLFQTSISTPYVTPNNSWLLTSRNLSIDVLQEIKHSPTVTERLLRIKPVRGINSTFPLLETPNPHELVEVVVSEPLCCGEIRTALMPKFSLVKLAKHLAVTGTMSVADAAFHIKDSFAVPNKEKVNYDIVDSHKAMYRMAHKRLDVSDVVYVPRRPLLTRWSSRIAAWWNKLVQAPGRLYIATLQAPLPDVKEVQHPGSKIVLPREDEFLQPKIVACVSVGCRYRSHLCFYPAVTRDNEYAAVHDRVTILCDAKADAWAQLRQFANRNPLAIDALAPLPFTTWVKRYSKSEQERMKKAASSLADMPLGRDSQDFIIQAFIKKEPTLYPCYALPKFVPRLIQGRSARYKAALGRFMTDFGDQLKKAWSTKGDADSRIIYTSGMNQRALGTVFSDALARYDHMQVIEDDFERFDASIGEDAVDFELACYKHAKGWSKDALVALEAQRHSVGYTKTGIRYEVAGKRKSGDMNTSCGNSLINGYAHAFALSLLGIVDYTMLVLGDDNLIMMSTVDFDRVRMAQSTFEGTLRDLGFKPKMVIRNDPMLAEYCSGLFYPVRGERGLHYIWGPKPGKTILKMFFCPHPSFKEEQRRAWLYEVALAYQNSYPYVPVLSAYADAVVQWGCPGKFTGPKVTLFDRVECKGASFDDTFELVASRYDVEPADVHQLHSYLLAVKPWDDLTNNPVLQNIIATDVKEVKAVAEDTDYEWDGVTRKF
jgi:hypothetical protein